MNQTVITSKPVGNREVAGSFVEISLVLPCLNEAATIGHCIREGLAAFRDGQISGEVLVADNGSTDGSQEIARREGAVVVQVPGRGYGSALMGGIKMARGRYVLIGDSDMSYDFSEMPRFLQELRTGQDLVIGCRMPRGGGTILPGAMPFLHRWLGNPVLSFFGRLLFRIPVVDFHCGIRAFSRKRILNLKLQTSGMEFATEMIVKASLSGLRISQVPVTLRRDGRDRSPHLRTWQDGWRHLRFMLVHAPRWLFFYPGFLVFTLCAAAFIGLLFGPIRIGTVRFDTNTLLLAGVGIQVGFEMVLLGLISEIFSRRFGLMPAHRLIDRILKTNPFQKSLIAGGILLLTGTLCLIAGILKWKHAQFGDLTYPDTLRLIVPAVMGISMGVQIVFGGFLIAVLGLDTRFVSSEDYS